MLKFGLSLGVGNFIIALTCMWPTHNKTGLLGCDHTTLWGGGMDALLYGCDGTKTRFRFYGKRLDFVLHLMLQLRP